MNELEIKILTLDLSTYTSCCELIRSKQVAYYALRKECDQTVNTDPRKQRLMGILGSTLYDEISQLQKKAWSHIGKQLGLNLSRRPFIRERLIEERNRRKYDPSHTHWPDQLIDHAHWGRKRVPKAIITNTHLAKSKIEAVASSIGLKAYILPISAYYPQDMCTAVILVADPHYVSQNQQLVRRPRCSPKSYC